ncbi:MAG: hypothetical protein FWF04_05710, partial [Clostridiales bacterium]|nr:hypothetical protein [Clostridiales bacterium]
MKSNVLTIMKKEFARFFKDRRLLIVLMLPAIMIYIMYSILGSALQGMLTPDNEYYPKAYIANMPQSLKDSWDGFFVVHIGAAKAPDAAAAKEKVAMKEADICVVFPADFDMQVAAYDAQISAHPAPNIEVYYNST